MLNRRGPSLQLYIYIAPRIRELQISVLEVPVVYSSIVCTTCTFIQSICKVQ